MGILRRILLIALLWTGLCTGLLIRTRNSAEMISLSEHRGGSARLLAAHGQLTFVWTSTTPEPGALPPRWVNYSLDTWNKIDEQIKYGAPQTWSKLGLSHGQIDKVPFDPAFFKYVTLWWLDVDRALDWFQLPSGSPSPSASCPS